MWCFEHCSKQYAKTSTLAEKNVSRLISVLGIESPGAAWVLSLVAKAKGVKLLTANQVGQFRGSYGRAAVPDLQRRVSHWFLCNQVRLPKRIDTATTEYREWHITTTKADN